MTRLLMVAVLVAGCRGKDEQEDEAAAKAKPCVVDSEVCMTFDSGWSASDAADECDAFAGEIGQCPDEPVGTCLLEDGVTFLLYGINPVDAAAYCDYLVGEWEPSA